MPAKYQDNGEQDEKGAGQTEPQSSKEAEVRHFEHDADQFVDSGKDRMMMSLRNVQHVSYAADGVNHFELELVIDLTAKVADVDVDDVSEAVVIHIPDVFDDHGAAERAAAIAHHVFENAELFGGKLDVFVAARDFAADAIESEIADLELLRGGRSAAKKNAGAGEQFDKSKGLDQIVIGALFKTFDTIVDGIPRAENQDRWDHFAVFDFLKNLETVDIGQAEIEDHEVVLGGMNPVNGVVTVMNDIHRIAGTLQAARQKICDSFLIFNY